jgi:hypothetical protein
VSLGFDDNQLLFTYWLLCCLQKFVIEGNGEDKAKQFPAMEVKWVPNFLQLRTPVTVFMSSIADSLSCSRGFLMIFHSSVRHTCVSGN